MGAFQFTGHINKFGHDNSVTTTDSTVWPFSGSVTWASTAETIKVTSGSVLDTSTGSGARTVRVWGLGSTWGNIVEDVTLTGRTAANTANTFMRVERIRVLSGGTDYNASMNQGAIYAGIGAISTGVPATIRNGIRAGDGQTTSAFYTVPGNRRARVRLMRVGTSALTKVVTLTMRVRPDGEVFTKRLTFNMPGGHIVLPYNPGLEYSAKTDIEFRAVTSAGTEDVVVEFDAELTPEVR